MPEQATLSLPEIEADIWYLLTAGSKDPKNAFYTGTLATLSASSISQRTVVLREVLPAEKSIVCYSDKRAAKIKEIEANRYVNWLFWNSEKKIQLRLSGKASVHINDELAARHWLKTTPSNRRSYMALEAPGTFQPLPTSGLPPGLDTRQPTRDQSEQGKINFAVIITAVHSIDWLFLGSEGHRRAKFVFKEDTLSEASWVIP